MHLYQMSTKLLGDTVGKMNDNLTSLVLAASAVMLTFGYFYSKILLRQTSDKNAVSCLKVNETVTWIQMRLFSPQTYPPYIPSSVPFLGHAVAFGKSPIDFLENAYEKVSSILQLIFKKLWTKLYDI